MERDVFTVFWVTLLLFFYALMPRLGFSYDALFIMFLFMNVAVIHMVYSVLKYGKDSGKRFSNGYWYADREKTEQNPGTMGSK